MKQSMVMGLIAVVMIAATGMAQSPADYAGAPATHWHEIDSDVLRAFKNPMEGVEMGLDLRLRNVYGRNILSLDDSFGDQFGGASGNFNNYHWQRYRLRWSTKWALTDDIDFRTRLTWEFWTHCRPDNHVPAPRGPGYGKLGGLFGQRSLDLDEAIFDHFNFQFRNAFDLPLTITVGRQDIILGTGWLVLDGTPGDGSRTIYFDAIRAEYMVSDATKLDLIYIQQYDDPGKWLKPFNHHGVQDRRNLTQGQDERGVIVYATNKLTDMTNLDGYYIYKRERQSSMNKYWLRKGFTGVPTGDAEVHTFGARLYGKLDENWSYSAEGALQFGKTRAFGASSRSQQGLGTNNELKYSFHDELKNEVRLGYEYLSGDNGSGTNTHFNSLWGDWPQFQRGGDLQSYIWAFEYKGLGNVGNMHRAGIGHSFKPHQDWTLKSDYNLLWADRNPHAGGVTGPGGAVTYSNSGNFRGQMLSGIATYRCCKNFSTHFMLDYFIPGNYYGRDNRDDAFFARVNMEWTF